MPTEHRRAESTPGTDEGQGLRRRIVQGQDPVRPRQTPIPAGPEPEAVRAARRAHTARVLRAGSRQRPVTAPGPDGQGGENATEALLASIGREQADEEYRAARRGTAGSPGDGRDSAKPEDSSTDSDAGLARTTGSMAVATLVSRITGFLKTVLMGASLGPFVSSAFNSANQLPNLITEIVLGAVLTSLVVPVLVRAEREDPDHGEAFIRRLLTVSSMVLLVVTVVSVMAAPWITRLSLRDSGQVNVPQAVHFAYLLLPQIFFYGLSALLMAVLNTKGVFKPGAWAPVWNNLVAIGVFLIYLTLPGELDPWDPASVLDPHVILLALGSTLGVVVQAFVLIGPLRRAGVNLRPLWGIDDRLKQFAGMGIAIVVYVGISQAGYFVTNQIASAVHPAGPISYQQSWLLLQMPYGIIGVTLLTAIMPRLSRNAAAHDTEAVVHDLTQATKLTLIGLLPIVVFFTAFGPDIGQALFGYQRFAPEFGRLIGTVLSLSAFTLVPYALVLLHLRVFYAREEAWTPTWIILAITATKVTCSLAALYVMPTGAGTVVMLGVANGAGFCSGAIIGIVLLRRLLGPLQARDILHTVAWVLGASIIGTLAALATNLLLGAIGGKLVAEVSVLVLLRMAVVGVVFLVVTGLVLSRSRLPELAPLGAALGGAARRVPGLRSLVSS